jgi:serine/threonine protein kinase/tetratricopeptide (TPR) repeat protein
MAKRAQAETIFGNAIEIGSVEERNAFLDEACHDDPALRQEVEKLVQDYFRAGEFLEQPVAQIASPTIDQPITEKPGTQIGPYKLLQQLGEGGMGVVYMAEQKEPVKRRVALKIIKPGMDTRQVIARFEAERQALAMMDHPNIAKVLDAGQTESGRPYFVMELVNGLPVTKYCDEQHLTPKERLELFVPLCHAVQHAHQKGIIHRDLKPGNILVALYDGRAVPKIIDFGVAKATSQALTEKTMFTQLGQVVGTLEYMSPEQAERNQLDIDTRSDIYSLGVVLYELLTGETPFDRERLRSAAFDEMLRIIREEEPPKPSTKVSSSLSLPSIASNRRVESARLSSTIRGELDWIVMKALEKDRARRYETASKFADDVQHYLNDDPVEACPPSAIYRFRKFTRRNKFTIGTISVIAVSLIAGMVGTTWQAYRAMNAERDALEFAADAQAQAARADKEAEKVQTQAAITRYLAEGSYDLAERDVLQQLEIHKKTFGEEHRQTLATMNILAIIYHHQGRNSDAERLVKQKLDIERRTVGEADPNAIQSADFLAKLYRAEGRYDEAEQLHQRILEFRSRTLGEKHPDTLQSMNDFAQALRFKGDRDGAIDMYQGVLNLDPNNQSAYVGLIGTLESRIQADEKLGRFPEVIGNLRRVVELRRNSLATMGDEVETRGPFGTARFGRQSLAEALRDLGYALDKTEQLVEAEGAYREGLIVWQQLIEEFPEDEHLARRLADNYRQLGYSLTRRRECAEALECFKKALEAAPDHYRSYHAMAGFRLHASDLSFRDPEQAARYAARAVELNPRFASSHRLLGEARYLLHDWTGAIESFKTALELGLLMDARTGLQLAICYAHLDEQKKGAEWYAKGVALMEKEEKQTNAWLAKLREQAEKLLGIATPQNGQELTFQKQT